MLGLNKYSKLSEKDADAFFNKLIVIEEVQSVILIRQGSSKANILLKIA